MKIVIESVVDPVWADAEKTRIYCMVKAAHMAAPLRFLASPTDSEAHGREIYAKAASGAYGEVAPYTPPPAPVGT